jgi:histidyl-tRNA synthetase
MSETSSQITMRVVISPQSLLETGIRVEKVDDLRLFKFTDDLQDKLEDLLAKNQSEVLTITEQEELNSISELDRIFTYLNSLLVAQK